MNTYRKNALIGGILYITAAVTAIIGLLLYGPVLYDPEYIINGSVNGTQVIWGAFLEIILAFSVIGISAAMFPILKRYNESLAIGYVCFRLLEAAIIIVGIMSLLSIVSLSQQFANGAASDVASFITAGKLLVSLHDWTFLFGPNLALGPSTLMMSYILYRTKLVPRFIAVLGLTGGSLILVSAVLVMLGIYTQVSAWGIICSLPVAIYEMTLAVWLIVKGFNPSAFVSESAKQI